MTEEISMLDQIATFTTKLHVTMTTKMAILSAVKAECIFMVLQILDRDVQSYRNPPKEDITVRIWSVVDLLREVDTSKRNHVDRILTDRIMSHIMRWIFLETLGFFSFLGILLLTAYSYRMELVMCIVTVFSISMLCYVVSDLDSPFSGFFRVEIGVLEEVLRRLDLMYDMAKQGHLEMFYPDKQC
nr:hypothetical protein BaRGS_000614 [Batillaria attramentaria]